MVLGWKVPWLLSVELYWWISESFIFSSDYLLIFLLGVDIDAATKHGIKVARIPSGATGNSTACAEMAIYLMLGLLRKQV